jgi:hypothetical protein
MVETPRPTINVENLENGNRSLSDIKGCPNYDKGGRFCFRLGPCDGYWRWPWPEWIGLPTKSTVKEWVELMNGWMVLVMDPNKKDNVEKHIGKLLPYL